MDTVCENHDVAGSCTQECLDLVQSMNADYSEPMVYSDYLGGESTIDWSGCHGSPPMPEETLVLDPVAGRIFFQVTHPDGCMCGEHAKATRS